MPGQPSLQVQPTGVFPPQQPANPFGVQPQQPQAFGSFLQPQSTSFLQPQATGAPNPFRQSALFPQATGMPSFGLGIGPQSQVAGGLATNPFPSSAPQPQNAFPPQSQPSNPFPIQQHQATNPFPLTTANPQNPVPTSSPSFNLFSSTSTTSASAFSTIPAFASPSVQPVQPTAIAPHQTGMPIRPASAPLKAQPISDLQPVKTHQTGSRNPFGVPVAPAPPVPKIPTLFDLMHGNNNTVMNTAQQPVQPSPTGLGGFGQNGSGANTLSGPGMSNIASSFVFGNEKSTSPTRSTTMPLSSLPTGTTATSTTNNSMFTSSSMFTPLSSQPTSTTTTSVGASTPSISVSAPLKPQMTGFSGLKAFKPSSSFGAALLESLPPIPQSAPSTPGPGATNGSSGLSNGAGLTAGGTNPAPFSNTVGVGLRPQATGSAGVANPFRASMFATAGSNATGAFGSSAAPAAPGVPASGSLPAFGSNGSSSPFSSSGFGTNPGAGLGSANTSLFGGSGGSGGNVNGSSGFGTGTNAFGSLGSGFGTNGSSGTASLI